MKKGLLLGAGASYEVGMPLVKEFSNTLRINVLKRLDSKLFDFDDNEDIKKYFINLLKNESLNYEEVVGKLEESYLSNSTGHHVLVQLIECIQLLLLEEQMLCLKLFEQKAKDYYGLKKLVYDQKNLNVFTLNHDSVFEEICDYYKIPYKDGFYTRTTQYDHVGNFKTLTSKELEEGKLNFLEDNETGINLVKLHGAFDIFAAEDKKIFLKCYGDGSFIGSSFYEIKKIETHNMNICAKDGIRITNELCINDTDGMMQFLRRSLLSGAHKFKNKFEQIAPKAFLASFIAKLNDINELVVIGYGFGDSHINEIIDKWMSDKSKFLSIYDPNPNSKNLPNYQKYQNRIKCIGNGFTDFCLHIDSSQESFESYLMRDVFLKIREDLMKRRLAETLIKKEVFGEENIVS